MIRKKIALVGALGVGKTSLVRRFTQGIFSDQYQSTIGVSIQKTLLKIDEREVELMVWDVNGHEDFREARGKYLLGSSGYLVVSDVTRSWTLESAREHQLLAEELLGKVPYEIILNKTDAVDNSAVTERARDLRWYYRKSLPTSAKDGSGVQQAFEAIARASLS